MKKAYKIEDKDIRPLLKNWIGADGCLVTDKIMVDGCKVGYMYRDNPINAFDSGWRFFEGNESSGYINNPENLSAPKLNTLCNYDPDVLPFLKEAEGSAFKRNAAGFFEKTDE